MAVAASGAGAAAGGEGAEREGGACVIFPLSTIFRHRSIPLFFISLKNHFFPLSLRTSPFPKHAKYGPQAQPHAAPSERGHRGSPVPREARAERGAARPAEAPSCVVDASSVADCPFDRSFFGRCFFARSPPRALPGPDAAPLVVGRHSSCCCVLRVPFEGPDPAQGRGQDLLPLPLGERRF